MINLEEHVETACWGGRQLPLLSALACRDAAWHQDVGCIDLDADTEGCTLERLAGRAPCAVINWGRIDGGGELPI